MPKRESPKHAKSTKSSKSTKPVKKDEEWVVAPGGPKRRDMVHKVEAGQTVQGSQSGAFSVVTSPKNVNQAMMEAAGGDYVLTPGGFRPRELVHKIEPGMVLQHAEGRFQALHKAGELFTDLGNIIRRTPDVPLMPANVMLRPPNFSFATDAAIPAFGTGWIAYAYWTNDAGQPVSSFATTWVVPPAPSTDNGQTIFLFNGIQNSTMIYQPVLQWGPSAAGGGSYWTVASWYADGQGGSAFYSSLVNVNVGDTLVGIMTRTGQNGSNYNYFCEFQGIANTGLTIQNVEELTWNIETLEAYGITACSDYPNTARTRFQSINMQCGTVTPTVDWTDVDAITDCCQHCNIVSENNPGGIVDIYYICAPVITWSNPAPIVYGTPLGPSQLSAISSEGGSFSYNPPSGTCLPAGTQNLTATFTPSDPSHEVVTKTVQIVVQKATPNLAWSNPATIVYGTALDGTQLNAQATWNVCSSPVSVSGNYNYSPNFGAVLSAGVHTLNVTFVPFDSTDYNNATASVQIHVLKATPLLQWANPADIDHGTPLSNVQLNANAIWFLGGIQTNVAGVFNYNPVAGTILPIGPNQALSVVFTPNDLTNYNAASTTVHINVLTGYPIILSATFSPATLPKEDRTQVTVVVKNDSVKPHATQEPNPGFEYSEGDTYETGAAPGRRSFPSIPGCYRIGVDLLASPYKMAKLYRWGFGHDLAPGETVTVTGYIRFHNSRENGQYYVAMIEEVNNILIDHVGTTGITVLRS